MKKVFLAFAFIAALLVTSCKQANEEIGKIDAPADSTTVVVDSVAVDSTTVQVDTVKVDNVK